MLRLLTVSIEELSIPRFSTRAATGADRNGRLALGGAC
jgi:hypothetical protein